MFIGCSSRNVYSIGNSKYADIRTHAKHILIKTMEITNAQWLLIAILGILLVCCIVTVFIIIRKRNSELPELKEDKEMEQKEEVVPKQEETQDKDPLKEIAEAEDVVPKAQDLDNLQIHAFGDKVMHKGDKFIVVDVELNVNVINKHNKKETLNLREVKIGW